MEMIPGSTMELTNNNASTDTVVDGVTAASTTRVAKPQNKVAGEKLAAEMAVFASVAAELRGKSRPHGTFEDRCRSVVSLAAELFGVSPTWTAFYREVLGEAGIVRMVFPESEDRQSYEQTEAHSQIFEMLTTLRSRDLPENDPTEPQRMITIRLPMTLHNAICAEANELEVSVNKLCISRMLQQLDDRMIPSCKNKRRGRRPGAASNSNPKIVLEQAG
jgi:predicted HicB family RNase H-like nuclease